MADLEVDTQNYQEMQRSTEDFAIGSLVRTQKVHTDECLVAKHHESRESLDVNCGRMTMEELASFVPDQTWTSFDTGQVEASLPEAWQWKKLAWL
jgi:hypothetical protein